MKDFILLIPCFNNTEGLITSLKSIQYQPDKFEVLVIDDGSKVPLNEDTLKKEIPGIVIKVLRLQENVGIAKALNAGLKNIHSRNDYKYIARLDCGDICHEDRFKEQVKYMDEHPEIGLLGSWCRFTDSISGKSYTYKTKTSHEAILNEMHLKCSFIHPTVMFKREVLDTVGYYPESYPHAEDYAYFWRILFKFKVHILPQTFVTVVISKNNLSYRNRKEQFLSRKKIVLEMSTGYIYKLLGLSYLTVLNLLPAGLAYNLKYIVKNK